MIPSNGRSNVNTNATAPQKILDIALAFQKSKILLTAMELGVFDALANRALDADALVEQLGLHGRGARDYFDALVALGMLGRDSLGRYANAADCAEYLNRRKPAYIGGLLE